MTTSAFSGSAKIYQFPTRGRAISGNRREDTSAADLISLQVTKSVCGSGWYHEEAVQEADRSRKN
jgi:hypothetical protein